VALDTTPKPAESIDGLPSGDLPVHATAAVVAVPGRRTAEVIIATRVGAPGGSSERTIELSAVAIDLGAKLRGQETMLDVENFSAARSADYQVTLPLAQLSAGKYLLEVEPQSADHRVQRAARFTVR
jgi:hypothetical protein